jgi:hypothetical protein
MPSSYQWPKILLGTVLAIAGSVQISFAQRADFLNFTYRPACREGKVPVTVRNGVFEKGEPAADRMIFMVVSVHLGDLTGDRQPEAVVVTYCNTGGSGGFTEGHIFDISGKQPVEIAKLPAGDRAFGGIVGIRILPPELRVTRAQGDAACCPKQFVTNAYKIENGKLVEAGPAVSRPAEN